MLQVSNFNSKNNVYFKGAETANPGIELANVVVEGLTGVPNVPETIANITTTVSDTFDKKKKHPFVQKMIDLLKQYNSTTSIMAGLTKGAVQGTLLAVVVGITGKSISDANGQISGTLRNLSKTFGKVCCETIKFVPNLVMKSPWDNIKSASALPKHFYKAYLNGHKMARGISAATGASVVILRTIQGKLNGNKKNSDVDHKLGWDHKN